MLSTLKLLSVLVTKDTTGMILLTLVSNSHSVSILSKLYNNCHFTDIPSPTILSSHFNSSTSIRLRWRNESATPVDCYIIRYYYTIRECAVSRSLRSPHVVYIYDSWREYTLYGLEKNGDYTISITAKKQGGESLPTITKVGTTTMAGTL